MIKALVEENKDWKNGLEYLSRGVGRGGWLRVRKGCFGSVVGFFKIGDYKFVMVLIFICILVILGSLGVCIGKVEC